MGANGISGGDLGAGRWIGLLEQRMADRLTQLAQLLTQLRLRWHRRWFEATGEGLEIQATTSHQQCHAPALQLTLDAGLGLRLKFLQGDRLIGVA